LAAFILPARRCRLAIRFENAFSNSSWTRPSFASSLTGRYPSNHKTITKFDSLPGELTTLPEEYPGIVNVHLDAVEHGEGIVFLHALRDGPANQSYGLQVAALAGVPRKVSSLARLRRPPQSVLRQVLREHLAAFKARVEEADRPLPAFVERELEAIMHCADPRRGLTRWHCDNWWSKGTRRRVSYNVERMSTTPPIASSWHW